MFCQHGGSETNKQKMAEALKGIKIKFKTVLSSGKNVVIGVLHQIESTWKVTEVETCKNKFWVLGGPPLYRWHWLT